MKDLPPVISSYLTTGVPDIVVIFVVSILAASAVDGCVVAAAIGVSDFFVVSIVAASTADCRVITVVVGESDLFGVRGLAVVRGGRRARVILLPLRAEGWCVPLGVPLLSFGTGFPLSFRFLPLGAVVT